MLTQLIITDYQQIMLVKNVVKYITLLQMQYIECCQVGGCIYNR